MESANKTKELETRDIAQLLWIYALPAVISQIISSVYNIADRIFIGQGVGALAIAGLAITMPIMNIIHAFGSLIGVGSAARMSIILGKKDYNWAENILGNSMVLTFLLGIPVMLMCYLFMDDILMLFGATADSIRYAKEYMLVVLPGMFLTTLSLNLTGLIRATGDPAKSMWIMVIGAILNIILDPIFIFVLHWGIAGAAWATTISMSVTAILSIMHFIKPTTFIRFKKHAWSPRLYIFKNILMIGMSPFLMNVAASGVVALMNAQLIKYGGDLAVGAYGIANTFGSFLVMFIIGVCQGMQPIAGYSYGAQRFERLKGVYTLTLKVNVLCGLVGTILVLTIPSYLIAAFTTDAELINIGTPAIQFMVVMFPFIGFTITNSQFFMSIDKPWVAIVTGLSRQVLFLAPMCYIMPSVFTSLGWNGLTGVWTSATVCDVLGAVLAGSLLFYNRKVFSATQNIG